MKGEERVTLEGMSYQESQRKRPEVRSGRLEGGIASGCSSNIDQVSQGITKNFSHLKENSQQPPEKDMASENQPQSVQCVRAHHTGTGTEMG